MFLVHFNVTVISVLTFCRNQYCCVHVVLVIESKLADGCCASPESEASGANDLNLLAHTNSMVLFASNVVTMALLKALLIYFLASSKALVA